MPKNQALVEQLTVRTKICVILYSNPSVLDDEGGCRRLPPPLTSVCSPQVHVSLTRSESLSEPAVDLCRSLICNAFKKTLQWILVSVCICCEVL